MKYSKNQQQYIDLVGGEGPQDTALAIIGKLDMTIALLLGALRIARLGLEQGQGIHGKVAANGPTIGSVISSAIADAEKNDVRVIDRPQLVEVLKAAKDKLERFRPFVGDEYKGGMEYTTLMKWIDETLGIESSQQAEPEYKQIVYY